MAQERRPKLIVGNWKMNKTIAEARAFISGLALAPHKENTQVGIAVPYTLIPSAAHAAHGTSISIGGQNVSDNPQGAFTGEISWEMLQDAGASFVIVGHSERRRLFHEDDHTVNRKALRAVKAKLRVIVCIGETAEQRQEGKTTTVLNEQLVKGLKDFTSENFHHLVIAYEPRWAIGTNQTASPEQAQQVHRFCREIIAQRWGKTTADQLIIQYGGSVRSDNASALLAQPDIDGLLVGNASLELGSFIQIIESPQVG